MKSLQVLQVLQPQTQQVVKLDWSYMANDEEDHALVSNKESPLEFSLMANTIAESKPIDSTSKSKTNKTETPKKPPVKYVEQYRKPNKKPTVRGNQRNWKNLKSHQLGPIFVMKKKACFNCGGFNHLAYDCRKGVKQGTSRSQNNTHKSFISRTDVHKPYRPPMRPVRTNINGARPNKTYFNKPAHSYTNRPFQRKSVVRSQYRAPWVSTVNRNFSPVNRKFSTGSRNFPTANRKFPIANKKFPTGGTKFHTADIGKKEKAVKPLAYTGKFEQWQLRIQQYLQHEHYTLWEVIEFGDSYEVPTSTASTTTTDTTSGETGKKSGRTITLTAKDMQKRKNDFMDVEVEQDDLNPKFLTSLAPEWLMHTIVWRNKSDLDTMSLEDLYNHLKVYESEVPMKSKPNSQNMAFISSVKLSRGNEDGNSASVSTASTNVPTASANNGVASISQDTACAYIASQSRKKISIQGSDMAGFDKSKDWSYMANDEEDHALVADKESPLEFSLMANTIAESKTGLPEFKDDTLTDYSRPKPTVESFSDDVKNRNPLASEIEASPTNF
nr:ribonuclease H-like domain-containing protein [Tanacetum cinerariifolium]